jgi:D-psicose/D-tagatose/L-ribulose 3-epimerase
MRNRFKVGTCTWVFGELSLGQIAQRLGSLGFDGVELMGDLESYSPREAEQILKDEGLEVFSLTPANVDLAHPNTGVRLEAIDYYLRLLDFAVAIDQPLISCHGYVGRIRAISSLAEEKALFADAVRQVAERAQTLGLCIVMEVLNRYEAHLLNTAAETVEFVAEVGADNVGILLDAYHMNIEEPDPAAALRLAADHLWLYHAADSNRQAIGRGHTDFRSQVAALSDIGYDGPVILECTAPGPDPFTAIKGEESLAWVETYLRESRSWLLGVQR